MNRTLTPYSMINGNACFAYFNKIWGIPNQRLTDDYQIYVDATQPATLNLVLVF